MPDDCEHEVLSLAHAGEWHDDRYQDRYECTSCGATFYEDFTSDGFVDTHGDDFDLDGRELL